MKKTYIAVYAIIITLCLGLPASASSNTLSLNSANLCAKPGGRIVVTLNQSNLAQPTVGYEVFAGFDNSRLSLVTSDVTLTSNPYGFPFTKSVSGGNVDLSAAVNFMNQQPTTVDAVLATMNFTAGQTEGTTRVVFRAHQPGTQLTGVAGAVINPVLLDSPDIIIDATPPSVVTPEDLFAVAAAGTTHAVLNPAAPSASDTVSGIGQVTGARSDGKQIAEPYPVGVTTITWTASDRAGNEAICRQQVVVAPSETVNVKSVAEAKTYPDNTSVKVSSAVLVRSFGSFFYIEDEDRAAGIRVNRVTGNPPAESSRPVVIGVLRTVDGERVIDEATVMPYDSASIPQPMGVAGRSLASPLAEGLLVVSWGSVELQPGVSDAFVLRDGSPSGVLVQLYGASLPTNGSYRRVVGVVGRDATRPVLRVNSAGDIGPAL